MNANLWSIMREYIAAEVKLAGLRHEFKEHPTSGDHNILGRIALAEEQSTRMETAIREAINK